MTGLCLVSPLVLVTVLAGVKSVVRLGIPTGHGMQVFSRNSGQSLRAEGGPQPPASSKSMLAVLQLQGNEFFTIIGRGPLLLGSLAWMTL